MNKDVDKDTKEYEFEPPKSRLIFCMPLGIAIGMGLGMLLGSLIHNIGAGVCFGAGVGIMLGFLIDIILEKMDK